MRSTVVLALVSCVACGGTTTLHGTDEADGGTRASATDGGSATIADGGGDPSANDGGTPAAEPFDAPAEKWTWVDVLGTECADGSPTGVGVNLEPGSKDVLVFLQGGGACWDYATCWGVVETSFYVATGYGRVEFATDAQRLMFPLVREDTDNPFRHANMIYVPYCTGDVHSGDADVDYELAGLHHLTHHRGYRNLGLVLDRVAATFPDLHKLWLAGDSAGGFGAALNFDRTQRRFPDAEVDVLDDSGPPIQPANDNWRKWRTTWNVPLPADCPACADRVDGMIDYDRAKYPNDRFALVSYEDDAVITSFMGLFPTTFYDELMALGSDMDEHWPNGHYYYRFGTLHVGLLVKSPGLVDWLQKFASDDPGWSSHAF